MTSGNLQAYAYMPRTSAAICSLTRPAGDIKAFQTASGAAFGHFLLRVGDRALQGLYVVAFCLADYFFDGAGYGGVVFWGRGGRGGEGQGGAAAGGGGGGALLIN